MEANIMHPLLPFIAYGIGYLEQYMFDHSFRPGGKTLFGWITISYHIPLVLLCEAICVLGGAWWFIGVFMVLEDDAFFRFDPAIRNPKSWVNGKLGGFYILGAWIPNTYWIGIGISILLWGVDYSLNEALR